MEQFDRDMAIAMMDDALQAVDDPVGRGIAMGLCSAFYLCGMLEPAEWERYQERILEGSNRSCTEPADHNPDRDYSGFLGYAATAMPLPRAKSRNG